MVDRDRLSVAPALYSRHHTLLLSLQFLGALQYLVSELRCNSQRKRKLSRLQYPVPEKQAVLVPAAPVLWQYPNPKLQYPDTVVAFKPSEDHYPCHGTVSR